MTSKLKPKISVSEELLSSGSYKKSLLTNNLSNSFHSPYEIFRNNTTAVEVIVKEIKHRGKRQIITNVDKKDHEESAAIKRLEGEIKKLRSELHETNSKLEEKQRCFKVILCEMKKQLDIANQRELQTQTKNLVLQLEKEKLRMILDSKLNLVAKLKKEFDAVRRKLKVVIKGIRSTQCLQNVYSDIDYDDFERDLRRLVAVPRNSLDNGTSFGHMTS